MRRASNVLALGLIALIFCAPLFRGLQSVDQENDEAIYSYAVESILETGDWMNPRSSPSPHTVFLEKPPLKFWIVALPIRLGLLPDNDFGLRFWDALFGAAAFLYIFSFGRRMGGWLCGLVSLLTLYALELLFFNHGLRGNNMEAALVLAYAGGLYHYLRWSESERPGPARAHAAALGGFFFLAFMTKFVAALFLPAIVGAASLELPAVRTKAIRAWRTWLLIGAGVALLAAPWFVYQTMQPGPGVWSVMFGEHVVTRFKASLDPAHLHPWYYYFEYLIRGLAKEGTIWAVVGGAALIHWRVIRERWLAGTLVLYWFWLPFVLISLGSSKLWHYAYPFLAPVALAAGYFVHSIASAVIAGIEAMQARPRASWLGSPSWRTGPRQTLLAVWPWIQRALIIVAIGSLVLGAVDLVRPGRLDLLGLTIWPQRALRSGLTALLLGLLAGRGLLVARVAVPLALLALMPFPQYRAVVDRTTIESHPLRSTRDCVADVRRDERAAGRPVPEMLVYLPRDSFSHPLYFYYRSFGWDERPELPDAELLSVLDGPEQARPILVADDIFTAIRQANDRPGRVRPSVAVNERAVMVLPGPYSRCAF